MKDKRKPINKHLNSPALRIKRLLAKHHSPVDIWESSRRKCPVCSNREPDKIIKLRSEFFECRYCGYEGDLDAWFT